jgi:hypothetical protein
VDLHIPFTGEDIYKIECNLCADSPIKHTFGCHGAGMKDAMSVKIDEIISKAQTTNDVNRGVYRIETFVISEEGKPFPDGFLEEINKNRRRLEKQWRILFRNQAFLPKFRFHLMTLFQIKK